MDVKGIAQALMAAKGQQPAIDPMHNYALPGETTQAQGQPGMDQRMLAPFVQGVPLKFIAPLGRQGT